ncbi:MAG: hypothetical protein JO126_07685 [Alphaproteobacteria bacterium]|nr:hypothetical protein [Alphaproteobacteria bacterium]MBV8549320.1 hypothetical protein [Alphaproteobacteria bacterium]
MKNQKLSNEILQGLMMAAVVAAALPIPEMAFAQNLANSVDVVHTGMSRIPNIIAGLFYMGGAGLIGTGAMKLKKHAEGDSGTTLGHGLGRVGAGTALIAMPAFGNWLNNSMAIGYNGATSQSLGTIQ